jgi:hypothetical protein
MCKMIIDWKILLKRGSGSGRLKKSYGSFGFKSGTLPATRHFFSPSCALVAFRLPATRHFFSPSCALVAFRLFLPLLIFFFTFNLKFPVIFLFFFHIYPFYSFPFSHAVPERRVVYMSIGNRRHRHGSEVDGKRDDVVQLLIRQLLEIAARAATAPGRHVSGGTAVEAGKKACRLGGEAALRLGEGVEGAADGVLVEQHGGDQLELVEQGGPVLPGQPGEQAHVLHP